MNAKYLTLTFVCLIAHFSGLISCSYAHDNNYFVIKGTVVAYLMQTPAPAIDIDGSRGELVVIKVDKTIKGKERSTYVIAIYQYQTGQPKLQKAILEGKAQARFALTRQDGCDQSLLELEPPLGSTTKDMPKGTVLLYTPPLVRLPDAQKIPKDLKLPCYTFGPSDVKVVKNIMERAKR